MQRIVIVGTTGSGKTTLARALSEKCSLPHEELDALHWGPNWTPRPDFVEQVQRAIAGDRWVMEGNYSKVRAIVWQRADTIIWLDFPLSTVFLRNLRRTISRSWNRTELYGGNRESWAKSFCSSDSILLWCINTWRRRKRDVPRQLRAPELKHVKKLRFRTPAELARWLQTVTP